VGISKKSNDIHVEIKNGAKIRTLVFLNVKQMFRPCTVTFRSKDLGVESILTCCFEFLILFQLRVMPMWCYIRA